MTPVSHAQRRSTPPARACTPWVMRGRPEVACIARPWRILRCADPAARFVCVPVAEVHQVAAQMGARPGDIQDVEMHHAGDRG